MGTATSSHTSNLTPDNKPSDIKKKLKHSAAEAGLQHGKVQTAPTRKHSENHDKPKNIPEGLPKTFRQTKAIPGSVNKTMYADRKRFKLTEHHMMPTGKQVIHTKKQKLSEENENKTKTVQNIKHNQSHHYKQRDKKQEKNTGQKEYTKRKTGQKDSAGSVGKQITLRGAQLGKYTDIYLRPCDTGNLEIKEYLPVNVTGSVVVEEDKFVVTEEMKKLVTYTAGKEGEYGKFGTWIEFKSAPRGICRIGDSLFIALSDRTVKQVSFQDKLNLENSFFVDYKCSGIMEYKGNLAVGLENGKINIVDTKGECLKKIVLPQPHQKKCIPKSLVETPDGNIMFCDSSSNTVMCIKDDGSVVFIYRGMQSPYCAIYDPYKNIIVVGVGSDAGGAIQLLTDKANKVKVLKHRKELGMQPYYIVNVKDRMKLAMCGDSNKIQFYHVEKCNPRTKRELAMEAEK